jgi:putative ABC transport system permease protein
VRYAWDGLRRRPGRSLLAGLGIGLATALVVTLLALSAGVEDSASRLAVASGVDLLATSANTTLLGDSFPPLTDAHAIPAGFVRADPNVAVASPWLVSSLVYANASLYRAANQSATGGSIPSGWAPVGAESVGWIPGNNAGLEAPTVVSGPGFSNPGDPHYANGTYRGPTVGETVLDQGLAQALHVGPGGTVWVATSSAPNASALPGWFASAVPFRVVGISGPFWLIPSALLGFFDLSELQSVQGGQSLQHDEASIVLVHLADPTNPASDQSLIEAAFPALSIFTLADVLGEIQQVVNLYRTFGTLIGGIAIVVATLFTSTVLLMSVDDRSREIALLRAIGYPRSTVGMYVLEESVLLSVIGLAIGAPIGYGVGWGINQLLSHLVAGLPIGFTFVSFDASVAIGALAEVLVIAFLAAVLPVVQALRVPIAEELRAP